MNYVESFNFLDMEAKQIPCIKGNGAPTETTEGAVGCFYMDIKTGELYKCTFCADNVFTWVLVSSGNYYTIEEIDEKIGDIETLLGGI